MMIYVKKTLKYDKPTFIDTGNDQNEQQISNVPEPREQPISTKLIELTEEPVSDKQIELIVPTKLIELIEEPVSNKLDNLIELIEEPVSDKLIEQVEEPVSDKPSESQISSDKQEPVDKPISFNEVTTNPIDQSNDTDNDYESMLSNKSSMVAASFMKSHANVVIVVKSEQVCDDINQPQTNQSKEISTNTSEEEMPHKTSLNDGSDSSMSTSKSSLSSNLASIQLYSIDDNLNSHSSLQSQTQIGTVQQKSDDNEEYRYEYEAEEVSSSVQSSNTEYVTGYEMNASSDIISEPTTDNVLKYNHKSYNIDVPPICTTSNLPVIATNQLPNFATSNETTNLAVIATNQLPNFATNNETTNLLVIATPTFVSSKLVTISKLQVVYLPFGSEQVLATNGNPQLPLEYCSVARQQIAAAPLPPQYIVTGTHTLLPVDTSEEIASGIG